MTEQGAAGSSRRLERESGQCATGYLASGLPPCNNVLQGELEGAHELDEGRGCILEPPFFDRKACSDPPCELCPIGWQLRGHPPDLAQRHALLKRPLQPAARLRGLTGVHAIEHERLGQVVAFRMREQARPEVVVLTLEVLGVVAQAVQLEHLAVDDDARMEERRAEERGPANRLGPDGIGWSDPRRPEASSSNTALPRTAIEEPETMRFSCRSSRRGNAMSSASSRAT